MSLIIKGIELPTDDEICYEITYKIGVTSNGCDCRVWMKDLDEPMNGKFKPIEVIEIPTPHGRLIDGDIVADMLDSMMVHKTLNSAYDEVLNMPTILESEE